MIAKELDKDIEALRAKKLKWKLNRLIRYLSHSNGGWSYHAKTYLHEKRELLTLFELLFCIPRVKVEVGVGLMNWVLTRLTEKNWMKYENKWKIDR